MSEMKKPKATSKDRIECTILAAAVADRALQFMKPESFVDETCKKIFLNSMIKAVNDLKTKVMSVEGMEL